MTEAFVVDEEFGPDERYRIFGREGRGAMTLLATCPSPEAIGVALATMAEDRWDAGDEDPAPTIAILDGERGRFLCGAWR